MNRFDNKCEAKMKTEEESSCIQIRYVQMLLFALIKGIIFGSRSILSIAIVAMTTQNTSKNPNVPVYNWEINSVILSSFYWSYAIIQFFACWISHAHGPKWYMAGSILIESLINLFIPVVADNLGANALMVCRIVQGFAQGMIMPLNTQLMGKWLPSNERTWMCSVVTVGTITGPIIVKFTSGYIAASWVGWPAIFYIYGSVGVLVSILWMVLGFNNPSEHPRISRKEKTYIESSLGQKEDDFKVNSIPWRAIFTSLPFMAILASAVGESWSTTLLSTEMPTYFAKVLSLNITSNGIYTTLTSVVSASAIMLFGPISDILINKHYLSRANVRRLFNTFAFFFSAACLVSVTYVSYSQETAIALFIIKSIGSSAMQHMVNMLDISPRYCGILMGLANGFGQLIAIFAPLCVQFIVYDESDPALWRIVFILSAIIFIITDVFFVIFMSAERQSWDSSVENTTETERKKSTMTVNVIEDIIL